VAAGRLGYRASMLDRAARACVALLVTAAFPVATAVAQTPAPPVPVSPADGATRDEGEAVPFSALGPADTVVLLSRSSVAGICGAIADEAGRLTGVATGADPSTLSFTSGELGPGTWFWQAVSPSNCSTGPARRLVVRPAALAPIPARIGTSNRAHLVIATAGVGEGVSRARLAALVRRSAERWRLRVDAVVRRAPHLGDARSDVGFSSRLVPRGALGVTYLQRTRRVLARRVCSPAGCRTVRTALGVAVNERDLALRPDVDWQPGPSLPDRRQFDLETVIIHELGHLAGNRRHSPVGCRDTPMVRALDRGEWWRSPLDFHYSECEGDLGGRVVRRTIERTATVRAPALFVRGAS
jgi:hypothetical protein